MYYYYIIAFFAALILLHGIACICAHLSAEKQREKQFIWQDNHLAELKKSYADGSAKRIDEQDVCDFDLKKAYEDGAKLTDVSFLASHNSYKQGISKPSAFFYYLCTLSNKFSYKWPTLTEQLNLGIRSIELDAEKVIGKDGKPYIECSHKYYFDNLSSSMDIVKGLEEIALWSKYNPDHLPITLMIEIKKKDISAAPCVTEVSDIMELCEKAKQIFGDDLYTPKQMLGKHRDFTEMREANDYPTLESLRGKVLIYMHAMHNGIFQPYYKQDPTFATLPFFPTYHVSDLKEYGKAALFVLCDNPNSPNMSELLRQNYLVRTRADKYGYFRSNKRDYTLQNKFHIIATDSPLGCNMDKDYVVSYNGKMISLKTNK